MNVELSACIELLFTEAGPDFAARLRAAADADIQAVEFWNWKTKRLEPLAKVAQATGTAITGFTIEPRGHLVNPASHSEFLDGVRESCAAASQVGATALIAVSGNTMPHVSRALQHESLISALEQASSIAERSRVTIVLEPLNTRIDHVGNYLDSTEEALEVVRSVGRNSVRLLYDIYHSSVMGEDPASIIAKAAEWIGHIHIADTPGRNEPGTGAIDWARVCRALRDSCYQGRIGLEYRPKEGTKRSLEQVRALIALE